MRRLARELHMVAKYITGMGSGQKLGRASVGGKLNTDLLDTAC